MKGHPAAPPTDTGGTFSTDTSGLPEAVAAPVVELGHGATFELGIGPVAKQLGEDRVRMLAYNGSIPGPTLRVRQGSTLTVQVRNHGDIEATVHWHGLRLDNRYDGVPYETQAPIPIGGSFTYELSFPDPGLYWYHPHVREDYGLEMGLYGNIVVQPAQEDYWPSVDREVVITLDDVLVESGRFAPFWHAGPSHVAMGRFGNVMLTGGETELGLEARAGEVVRLYLTNTANTRLFNVALPGARMKLIGGDSGRYEHETFVEEVLLAPSERAVVDVLFPEPGSIPLQHRTPDQTYILGVVTVGEGPVERSATAAFEALRTDPDLTAQRADLDHHRARPPDKTLAFESRMPMPDGADDHAAHGSESGDPAHHGHGDHPAMAEHQGHDTTHRHDHRHDGGEGLEWEDLMPEMNRRSDPTNMVWSLVDRDTGKENWRIDWAFRVGDRVKIRLVNGIDQDHPMHHPFHIHGAGRFLVVARNGEPDPNLVWKDTVLVRAGETVDIVLEVTNPGLWMAHCHIAEHAQSGMMFSFPVT